MSSIRIDTGILKRGKSYTFTVSMGLDSNGKQIRKTTTFKPPEGVTEKKANKLAKEAYIEFKNRCKGYYSLNENMRFKDLVEEYLKTYAKTNLKPATLYNYESIFEKRFLPVFGAKKLKDISTGLLTNYFNDLTVHKKNGEVQPMNPSTVKRQFNVIQSVFAYAIKQNYIQRNPTIGVILPKKNPVIEGKRKYLELDEIPKFINMFESYSVLNTIVLVLLYTGLRSGECLALQWSDIDFENNVIYVNHNLADVGGKHFLTNPKTKTSKRKVYFGDELKKILLNHKEKQQMLVNAIGPSFEHPEMVFTSDKGNYKDRSSLNTSFRRYLKDTEFDFLTLHGLRHSNATLLLNQGVDLKVISEHLGHSTTIVTANIYTNVLDSTKISTAQLFENKIKELCKK